MIYKNSEICLIFDLKEVVRMSEEKRVRYTGFVTNETSELIEKIKEEYKKDGLQITIGQAIDVAFQALKREKGL